MQKIYGLREEGNTKGKRGFIETNNPKGDHTIRNIDTFEGCFMNFQC